MSQDTSLPARAERFATAAHASIGQVRKYTGEPYPVHLAGVARRVGETPGCSEAMIAAALDAGAFGAKINGSGGGGCMFAYAPDRPEIVYCEECYQQEVA